VLCCAVLCCAVHAVAQGTNCPALCCAALCMLCSFDVLCFFCYAVHAVLCCALLAEPHGACAVPCCAVPCCAVLAVQVPPGHVWLQGDNLILSRDSREYGPVPLALVKGRVVAQVREMPQALAMPATLPWIKFLAETCDQ
jgi:hypothetical protein